MTDRQRKTEQFVYTHYSNLGYEKYVNQKKQKQKNLKSTILDIRNVGYEKAKMSFLDFLMGGVHSNCISLFT